MSYEDEMRRQMETDINASFGLGSMLKKVGRKIKGAVYKRTPATKTTGEKIRIGPKGLNVTLEKRKRG